ncbi:MAG: fructosamine kinase family protein [Tepidisphaeraceae bacterium]
MPLHDSDISWQVLRQIVQDWGGASADVAQVMPLEGGCINTTLCVTLTDGRKCVLKIAVHRVNREFEREAYQLRLLAEQGIPVPRVLAQKTATLDAPDSYLLMEFVDGIDLSQARRECEPGAFEALQAELAEIVARLHDRTADAYSRVTDPAGPTFSSWPEFYRHVYDPIWNEAEKDQAIPVKLRKQIAKIHDKLPRLIANSDPPRLVHWDIWTNNLLVGRNGDGNWHVNALLDPNCKFAHAEAEIAYMDLFHTITPSFTKAYSKRHKLGDEYHRLRKPIYQMYPLINHVRLFGHDYIKPLTTAVERAMRVV